MRINWGANVQFIRVQPLFLFMIAMLFGLVVRPSSAANASAHYPGQYTLRLQESPFSEVRVAVPLELLERTLRRDLNKSGEARRNRQGNFYVKSLAFTEFQENTPVIALEMSVDGNSGEFDFGCDMRVRIAIPTQQVQERVVPRLLSAEPHCSTGGFFANFAKLMTFVNERIGNEVLKSFRRMILLDSTNQSGDLADFISEDAALWEFVREAYLQVQYCTVKTSRDICLVIGWVPRWIMTGRLSELAAMAPAPLGPVEQGYVRSQHQIFLDAARSNTRKPSEREPGYLFPAKKYPGGWDDGDMSIFGGLLCLAGEAEGCELVMRSQDATGRHWRSPDRVGEVATNSFSGDQLNGVIALHSAQVKPNELKRFLEFLSANKTYLPDAEIAADSGYKSCTRDDHNTCLLIGNDWYWLNTLADRRGLSQLVPADVRDVATRFEFTLDVLPWQAAFAPVGYRMHLAAVQLLLARKLGVESNSLRQAAAILAGRQPQNPLFLFLHLGKDKRVLDQLDAKCKIRPQQVEFTQWAWERRESEAAWEKSMLWDCVFGYRLLLD